MEFTDAELEGRELQDTTSYQRSNYILTCHTKKREAISIDLRKVESWKSIDSNHCKVYMDSGVVHKLNISEGTFRSGYQGYLNYQENIRKGNI